MRRIRWWGIVCAVGVATVVFTLTQRSQSISEAAAGDEDITKFLQRHWQVPIAPQGTPPATYSPLEASLHPKDCGVCHVQQYQDWQTSIHSRSMGSGLYGQLLNMESDPGTYTICATCHTPLQELRASGKPERATAAHADWSALDHSIEPGHQACPRQTRARGGARERLSHRAFRGHALDRVAAIRCSGE